MLEKECRILITCRSRSHSHLNGTRALGQAKPSPARQRPPNGIEARFSMRWAYAFNSELDLGCASFCPCERLLLTYRISVYTRCIHLYIYTYIYVHVYIDIVFFFGYVPASKHLAQRLISANTCTLGNGKRCPCSPLAACVPEILKGAAWRWLLITLARHAQCNWAAQ